MGESFVVGIRETSPKRPGPILCLDFDGVIHSYESGWKGAAAIPDPPVPGAIEAVIGYLDAGFTVAVFSSRSKNLLGRWAMKRWLGNAIAQYWIDGNTPPALAEAECERDAYLLVNRIKWPWFKPAALVTIDDRALTFTGEWPTPSDVWRFKPWNKR
jgi:hypothetical protein